MVVSALICGVKRIHLPCPNFSTNRTSSFDIELTCTTSPSIHQRSDIVRYNIDLVNPKFTETLTSFRQCFFQKALYCFAVHESHSERRFYMSKGQLVKIAAVHAKDLRIYLRLQVSASLHRLLKKL